VNILEFKDVVLLVVDEIPADSDVPMVTLSILRIC